MPSGCPNAHRRHRREVTTPEIRFRRAGRVAVVADRTAAASLHIFATQGGAFASRLRRNLNCLVVRSQPEPRAREVASGSLLSAGMAPAGQRERRRAVGRLTAPNLASVRIKAEHTILDRRDFTVRHPKSGNL